MATAAERARSFGVLAETYDRVRPTYPSEAIDAAVPRHATVVADVGAGTGKLTASLVARGLRVIAVEPDASMRALLAARVPAAERREGTAEALPVGDDEVDAVCFGQSWHWADPERASAEAARVLRPGGRLGLLWNVDDNRVPWVAAISKLTQSGTGLGGVRRATSLAGFCAGHRLDVAWRHRLSRADLLDLASTWSAVSTRPDDERRQVLDAVAGVLHESAEVAGADPVDFPQICRVLTYHLAGECLTS